MSIRVDFDAEQLMKDIKGEVATAAVNKASNGVEKKCPNCGKRIVVRPGLNVCPFCHDEITARLDPDLTPK